MSKLIESFWGGPRETTRKNPTMDEALHWATKHKYGAALAVGGVAAFAFLRPATPPNVIVVNPSGPVSATPVDESMGKALGVGALTAVVIGVALHVAEKK